LSKASSENSPSTVWRGKPWILPGVIARTVFVPIVAVLVVWLELALNVASVTFLGLQAVLWTGLVFFLVWLLSLLHLVLLRASNDYILRNDSLEVRTGILATKSFMIVPSGFSDLEVDRTVSGRIVNLGDIIIRSQSETDVVMLRVRAPLKVAEQVRKIMARPVVRIEGQDSPDEKI
jgi:membrane protein YdbS with pleckstrin-like domain